MRASAKLTCRLETWRACLVIEPTTSAVQRPSTGAIFAIARMFFPLDYPKEERETARGLPLWSYPRTLVLVVYPCSWSTSQARHFECSCHFEWSLAGGSTVGDVYTQAKWGKETLLRPVWFHTYNTSTIFAVTKWTPTSRPPPPLGVNGGNNLFPLPTNWTSWNN